MCKREESVDSSVICELPSRMFLSLGQCGSSAKPCEGLTTNRSKSMGLDSTLVVLILLHPLIPSNTYRASKILSPPLPPAVLPICKPSPSPFRRYAVAWGPQTILPLGYVTRPGPGYLRCHFRKHERLEEQRPLIWISDPDIFHRFPGLCFLVRPFLLLPRGMLFEFFEFLAAFFRGAVDDALF